MSAAHAWLLRDRAYPVKPRHFHGAITPQHLIGLCESGGVLASVRVRTERAEYPMRRGDGVIYPVGEFETHLTGPELLALSAHGEIVRVHRAATYEMGRPFERTMTALLAEREKCASAGDSDGESFCKLMCNSLPGKFAQKGGGWKREPADDVRGQWGNYFKSSSRTERLERFRYLCGAAYRWAPDDTGRGPHTAVACYLSAYLRLHMAQIRSSLPERAVVSQDTDGLWLLSEGVRILSVSGRLAHSGPGTLRVKDNARTGRFWGARHYRVDDRWILAGYRNPHVDPETLTVTHSRSAPLFGRGDRCAPRDWLTAYRVDPFPTLAEHGRPQPDGWILPHRIIPGAPLPEE